MFLSQLKIGDRAVITDIDDADGKATARLAARGIVPGISIGILRAGDPCLIGIDDERWALNRDEAGAIRVDRLDPVRRPLWARLCGR